MVDKVLKVIATIVVILALLVACADHGIIPIPKPQTNLHKVHSQAVACTEPVSFMEVGLRAVEVEIVEQGGSRAVTLPVESLKNMQYNLDVIDKAIGQRDKYSSYLLNCLKDIATSSVVEETIPEG
ncbi:MAG: hypothetical protein LPH21_19025 [Shewanella sp.]|nr:hypothetical protein [Shewanella sp.]